MDEIKILKDEEQREYTNIFEDYEEMVDEYKREKVSAETPRQFNLSNTIGFILIVIGLLTFFTVSDFNPWQYWWVIFFAKPFLFFGWGRGGWGWCGWHSEEQKA